MLQERLKEAVKGNYGIKQPAPFDMFLQRAGMKSALYDSMPRQAYEFRISCSKLPRRPQVIECDPICIVQRRGNNEFDGGWQEVFRTERLQNNRNPKFERKMRFNYFKAVNDRAKEPQPIRFIIADDHDAWRPQKHLSPKDAVVVLETTLEQIIDECEDPDLGAKKAGVFTREFKSNHEFRIREASISVMASKINERVNCPPLGAEAAPMAMPAAPSGLAIAEASAKPMSPVSHELVRLASVTSAESKGFHTYLPRTERWMLQFRAHILSLFKKFTSLGQQFASADNARASTLDTSEFIQMLHAIGILPSKAGMEGAITDVSVQQFGHKVGLLTKTDAFSVFDRFSAKDPESGCNELDSKAFTKAVAMMAGILSDRLRVQAAQATQPLKPKPSLNLSSLSAAASHTMSGAVTERAAARPRAGDAAAADDSHGGGGGGASSSPRPHAPLTARPSRPRSSRLAAGGREEQAGLGRLSSRRTHTATMLQRVHQELGMPYPLGLATSREVLPRKAPGPRKLLALPVLAALPGLSPRVDEKQLADKRRAKRPKAGDDAHGQGVLSAVRNAAQSYNPQICQCAAPAAAAMAGSGEEAAGSIETVFELFLKTQHLQVKADSMDALAAIVSKHPHGCEHFLELGGMLLVLKCLSSSSRLVHRKCLDFLEALVKNARAVEHRFSNDVLACLVAFIRSPDPFTAHYAAKVLLRLTRVAVVRGEVWRCFVADGDASSRPAAPTPAPAPALSHSSLLQLDGGT